MVLPSMELPTMVPPTMVLSTMASPKTAPSITAQPSNAPPNTVPSAHPLQQVQLLLLLQPTLHHEGTLVKRRTF